MGSRCLNHNGAKLNVHADFGEGIECVSAQVRMKGW
jgi:hypothetical protein